MAERNTLIRSMHDLGAAAWFGGLVLTREDVTAWKSVNNLPQVHTLVNDQLNTYDVLNADDVVFSVEALNAFINAADKTKEEAK